jgi:predicted ferric reductase
MAKKKNPVVHLKQSDVKKMKEEATNAGLKYAVLLFFTVMRDKEGYGIKRLKRIFDETTELADSINKGYVKWQDLEKVLEDEADIKLYFGE